MFPWAQDRSDRKYRPDHQRKPPSLYVLVVPVGQSRTTSFLLFSDVLVGKANGPTQDGPYWVAVAFLSEERQPNLRADLVLDVHDAEDEAENGAHHERRGEHHVDLRGRLHKGLRDCDLQEPEDVVHQVHNREGQRKSNRGAQDHVQGHLQNRRSASVPLLLEGKANQPRQDDQATKGSQRLLVGRGAHAISRFLAEDPPENDAPDNDKEHAEI
mmetsp:Transcript_83714/g.240619  ORF Transcript_83714/g.240619 Transcript_83714/m.240619 type:complete len:214 (+) Transcript_83714:140-781(+)